MIAIPLRSDADLKNVPWGTIALVLFNVAVHLTWTFPREQLVEPYMLHYDVISPLQWLTSAFLHEGWLHLIGNMVFLGVFGVVVEAILGRAFVPVYFLICLLSGGIEQILLLSLGREGTSLGASSAIFGILSLGFIWSPETRITFFVWVWWHAFIREVRLLWVACWYLGWEVLIAFMNTDQVTSSLLHVFGIIAALPIGLVSLRQRWVNCGGWDLFSLWRNRNRSVADITAELDAASSVPAAAPTSGPVQNAEVTEAKTTKSVIALDAAIQSLNDAVLAQDAQGTWRWVRIVLRHPSRWTAPSELYDDVVTVLWKGGASHEALQIAKERLQVHPDQGDWCHYVAGLALLAGEDNPRDSLAHLDRVRPEHLPPDAVQEFQRARNRALQRQRTQRFARA